jgi:lipoprotein-anchoring transpeptidase ErfK/SrfK
MKRIILTISMCVLLFSMIGGVSEAAGTFDAAYYARRYPDVVAELGTDPKALYDHYMTFGINEHRFQNAQEEADALAASNAAQNVTKYVDIDIANQTLTLYDNGEIRLQTACVTGTSGRNDTPVGTYSIDYKCPGKYLTGRTWKCWVDRWMRFISKGIGIHDATWRASFGGEIYKKNGSHGCVNISHSAAMQLYDMVEVGTVVIVH